MALSPEAIGRLRLQLLRRRHVLVQSATRNQRELEALKNQDPIAELEEEAQSSSAGYVVAHLGEAQRREVFQIDAALSRIEAGTYGVCVDCGAQISEERLRAVPFALRDAGCTSRLEAESWGGRGPPSL